MKPRAVSAVGTGLQRSPGAEILDTETKTLVQRWILAFRETPVLIDPDLMRRVLESTEAAKKRGEP